MQARTPRAYIFAPIHTNDLSRYCPQHTTKVLGWEGWFQGDPCVCAPSFVTDAAGECTCEAGFMLIGESCVGCEVGK